MREKGTERFYTRAEIEAYAMQADMNPRQAVRTLLLKGIWPESLRRNQGLLSAEQQLKLLDLPIFIAGCGGLGGEMAASLTQLGAGKLYLCDFDNFEESNLNRQRFCNSTSLGKSKARQTAVALLEKMPWGSYVALEQKLNAANLPEVFAQCALIVDCLDSVAGKEMLERAASNAGIAWLHGAVLENEGFACIRTRPGRILESLYGPDCAESGAGSTLSHVVGGTAAIMCSLLLKWLANPNYESPLLHLDFTVPEIEVFPLP